MPVYSFEDVVCDKLAVNHYEDGNWENSGWSDYYFSDGTMVGINEMETHNIKVYPNPVIDILNIEMDNFDETTCVVRNLNGQIVLQRNFQNKEQLQFSGITAGVYFVEFYVQEKRLHISKVIKR